MSKLFLNARNIIAALPVILLFSMIIPCSSRANDLYIYTTLQTKTYDEMLAEVKIRVKKTEAPDVNRDQASAILVDAIELVMSRPDSDGVVGQLMNILRTPMKNFDVYEPTLTAVSENLLSNAQNKKSKIKNRATAIVGLINFLSEFKPEFKKNNKIKTIFKTIRDSNIEISDDLVSEMHLNAMMKKPTSPSVIAKEILEEKPKKKKL